MGGEINAFTSKEHTCYYAHVLDVDLELAVDVVTDVVLGGLLPSGRRGRSSGRWCSRNSPCATTIPRTSSTRPPRRRSWAIIRWRGPCSAREESVEAMTAARLRGFHRRRYTPEKMVLAVAGNVTHAQVVKLARRAFEGRLDGAAESAPGAHGDPAQAGRPVRSRWSIGDGEQSHLVAGTRAYGRFHPDRWALSGAQHRDRRRPEFSPVPRDPGATRLAYTVYSAVDTYADTGCSRCTRGVRRSDSARWRRSRDGSSRTCGDDGLTAEELARAKGSLRGGLVLGLEDAQSRMHRMGRSELNYQNQRTITRTLAAIDKGLTGRCEPGGARSALAAVRRCRPRTAPRSARRTRAGAQLVGVRRRSPNR